MWTIKVLSNILIICMFLSFSAAVIPPLEKAPGPCGPLKKTISEEDDCYIDEVPTTCPNSSKLFSKIEKKCRYPYSIDGRDIVSYKCGEQGEWLPSYNLCQSDCGLGSKKNKYPWLVGIYNAEERLICPGTIISAYHVVTAAQCIQIDYVDYDGTFKINFDQYTIIAGKHYTNIRRIRSSQQIRKITKIQRHENYRDWSVAREQDVLILEVDKEFEFFDDVRPACVDWQSFYEEWDFKDGTQGVVVGWGFEKDEVLPCEAPTVQYWQKNICWENLPKNFRKQFFGDDKFCAQYILDNPTCGKEIGTGLFFKSDRQRYFLRGITSTFNTESKSYVLYTKISNYLTWFKSFMRNNKKISPVFETLGKGIYNSTGGCILPKHIRYGKFSLVSGTAYPENTWVPSFSLISLTCDDRTSARTSFRCLDNKWDPSIEKGTCKKPGSCASLTSSESERVYCKLNGGPINCTEPPTNTTATVICEPLYASGANKPIYKCEDGKWNPPFIPCSLECGTKRVGVTTLIIGGTEADVNEYPWVVAIYNKDKLVCGGTLISRFYVLSAAHCFVSKKGGPPREEDYTLVAGKYYRDLNVEELGSQKQKIKELYIHDDYKGIITKHRDDIALIELKDKFTASEQVQPVCVDWDNDFEDIDLTLGNNGIVAGWGNTQQGESPSSVLKKLVVPFQPKDVCIQNLPEDFGQQFVATDKICAGYNDNNTNVCTGDSGGGLYFKSDGSRFYIRGIVSLTVRSTVGCDANRFSLYTKVSKYLTWIENITRKIV